MVNLPSPTDDWHRPVPDRSQGRPRRAPGTARPPAPAAAAAAACTEQRVAAPQRVRDDEHERAPDRRGRRGPDGRHRQREPLRPRPPGHRQHHRGQPSPGSAPVATTATPPASSRPANRSRGAGRSARALPSLQRAAPEVKDTSPHEQVVADLRAETATCSGSSTRSAPRTGSGRPRPRAGRSRTRSTTWPGSTRRSRWRSPTRPSSGRLAALAGGGDFPDCWSPGASAGWRTRRRRSGSAPPGPRSSTGGGPGRRPDPAALVRHGDEPDLRGHRPADGDLGPRPGRRRRARRGPDPDRTAPARLPSRRGDPGFSFRLHGLPVPAGGRLRSSCPVRTVHCGPGDPAATASGWPGPRWTSACW